MYDFPPTYLGLSSFTLGWGWLNRKMLRRGNVFLQNICPFCLAFLFSLSIFLKTTFYNKDNIGTTICYKLQHVISCVFVCLLRDSA